MWVYLNNAFLSIVAHRTKRGHLLVRSRFPDDLARVFPAAMVETTPDADYRYRCTVTRAQVQAAMAVAVRDVTYPNFKNSVESAQRRGIYSEVWEVMREAQETFISMGGPPVSTRPCDLMRGGGGSLPFGGLRALKDPQEPTW